MVRLSRLSMVLAVLLLSQVVFATPVIWHNSEYMNTSVDACWATAQAALQRATYNVTSKTDKGDYAYVYASRAIHSAAVYCQHGPNGTTLLSVVVSSIADDNNVPSAEVSAIMSWVHNVSGNSSSNSGATGLLGFYPRKENWVAKSSNDQMPFDVMIGGGQEADGRRQYICRAHEGSDLIPGKAVTNFGTDCIIPYRNRETRESNFDVLTGIGSDYFWGAPNDSSKTPVIVGNESGVPLGSCRAQIFHKGKDAGWHLGKLVGAKCYVSYKYDVYESPGDISSFQELYHK